MYYELVLNSKAARGRVVERSKISLKPREQEAYVSLFSFGNEIHEHLKISKNAKGNATVSGYKGLYGMDVFYLDVDSQDVEEALDVTREIVDYCYEIYGVHPGMLRIYFSGKKGFHIGFPAKLFGGFEQSKDLPERTAALAYTLVADIFGVTIQEVTQSFTNHVQAYNSVDLGIYNSNRIFRIPNSKHSDSGLYKYLLTHAELMQKDIAEIAALAVHPSPNVFEVPNSKVTVNENLAEIYESSKAVQIAKVKQDPTKNTSEHFDRTGKHDAGDGFFGLVDEGGRNNGLFAQACMIFDHSDFSKTSVKQIIAAFNQASPKPLDNTELQAIIDSAYQKTKDNAGYAKPDPPVKTLSGNIETITDFTDEFVDYYSQGGKLLTCLFDEITEDQEGRLDGKLACFIGSGGTMKSYGVQNVLVQNLIHNNARVAISSMEMGRVGTVSRFMKLLSDTFHKDKELLLDGVKVSADEMYKDSARRAPEYTKAYLRELYADISNRCIMSSQGFATVKDYEQWIQKTIELYGEVDILIVDGLSMMGGSANETERFSDNTAGLKELAKKYNVFIPIICHTTKQSNPFQRDSISMVRGSEKILDNMDFSLCFSKLIDEKESLPHDIRAVKNMGHVRYWDKRGTGEIRNFVFNANRYTDIITQSGRTPDTYPTLEQFQSGSKRGGANQISPF